MKRMACEMCGSTELMKENGVFVCQNCGCKYSLEEAKKMLIEVDGPVEVHGEVKIDRSSELENYKVLMETAYEAGNRNEEVYDYCEKILQIDNKNARARLLKGISAGWLSSQNSVRFKETVMCFKNALSFASENKKEELIKTFEKEYENMGRSVCVWVGKQYMSFPDDSERAENTINAYSKFIDSIKELNETCSTSFDLNSLLDWCYKDLGIVCRESRKKAKADFGIEPYDRYKRSNRYNFQNYINTCKNNINIYHSMVTYANSTTKLIGLSCDILITSGDLRTAHLIDYSTGYINELISDECRKIYEEKEQRYLKEIEEKEAALKVIQEKEEAERKAKAEEERKAKEEAQKAANEKYWIEHSELKKELMDEQTKLNEKINYINLDLNKIYESINAIKGKKYDSNIYDSQIKDQKSHIANLNRQLSKLNIFKIKEKKELNLQIEEAKTKLKKLEAELKNEVQKFEKEKMPDLSLLEADENKKKDELNSCYSRLNEIKELFNKNY